MEISYQITGMTCSGCVEVVHESLSKVSGVKHVHVDLPKATAVLDVESPIALQNLRAALAGSPYRISESTIDLTDGDERILSDKRSENSKKLVTAYLTAAGRLDHQQLSEYLHPNFTYTGAVRYDSPDKYLNMIEEHAKSPVSEVLLKYDIKAIFVDDDECCAIYDSVSRFPEKNVSFLERITIKDGKIAATEVKFNRHEMQALMHEMSRAKKRAQA